MENFYFAYGYDGNKADRVYRRNDGDFEKYNFDKQTWEPSPEQSCIYLGEDSYYDEISQEDVEKLISI